MNMVVTIFLWMLVKNVLLYLGFGQTSGFWWNMRAPSSAFWQKILPCSPPPTPLTPPQSWFLSISLYFTCFFIQVLPDWYRSVQNSTEWFGHWWIPSPSWGKTGQNLRSNHKNVVWRLFGSVKLLQQKIFILYINLSETNPIQQNYCNKNMSRYWK